jgi:hypothetical protein
MIFFLNKKLRPFTSPCKEATIEKHLENVTLEKPMTHTKVPCNIDNFASGNMK